MLRFIFITSIAFNTFIKCYTGLISTHSANVYMHSIDSCFFVKDFNDSIVSYLKDHEKVQIIEREALFKNVYVLFTNEKPDETNEYGTNNRKCCDFKVCKVRFPFKHVSFEGAGDLQTLKRKKYVAFFDNENKNVLFYLNAANYVEELGICNSENFRDGTSAKKTTYMDFYFSGFNIRLDCFQPFQCFMKYFEMEDISVLICEFSLIGLNHFFLKFTVWKQFKTVLKNPFVFYNFANEMFEMNENKRKEIAEKIALLEEQERLSKRREEMKRKN